MTENPYARDPYEAADLTPAQERTWGTLTHVVVGVATALSAGTLGFVAALVVYLMYRERGPFVRHNAANAMNIQLNALLWFVLIGVVGLLTFGLLWFALALVPVVTVVLHALAAVHANNGDWYDPPFTVRFIR